MRGSQTSAAGVIQFAFALPKKPRPHCYQCCDSAETGANGGQLFYSRGSRMGEASYSVTQR